MKKILGFVLMNLVNKERLYNNINPITYNFQLHDYLLNNVTNNGSYFYESTEQRASWKIENNIRGCDLRGCFLKPLNFSYLFRDTYKNSIPLIFKYRLKQRNCDHTDFEDGKPCSWFYHYYPVLMSNYTSFACKSLEYQGIFVPDKLKNKQMRSFWCYFDSVPFYWPK